ncbi:tyrosine-protein phosphatase [Dyella sp. C9]|uniref:tyrosine-protein phosphatase n=1 Tax=Dyella sp. C9 TaxID=2202154 RepID=UPI000DEF1362|nr:tyrosine-protein phosphatase [Dyella sp. C9]
MKKTSLFLLALMPALALAQQAQPAAAPAAVAAAGEVAPNADDASRLVGLQGALNARDLGGLKGTHGAVPSDRFIRTADLSRLTDADKATLAKRGVALDIDLRTTDEATKAPDALANDPRFKYVRISLMGDKPLDMSHMPGSLGVLYAKALDEDQAQFKQVFEAMAAQKDGAVLYHCSAGKDRTGMISALLLSLAGVKRDDIVHNYAISAYYLKPMMSAPQTAAMLKQNPALAPLMGTPPEAMAQFLDALQKQYGGAQAYLRKIGVSDSDVQVLVTRLGQPQVAVAK